MNNFQSIVRVGTEPEIKPNSVQFIGYMDYYIKQEKKSWKSIFMLSKEQHEKLKESVVKGNSLLLQGSMFVEYYQDDNGINGSVVKCFVSDCRLIWKPKQESAENSNVTV